MIFSIGYDPNLVRIAGEVGQKLHRQVTSVPYDAQLYVVGSREFSLEEEIFRLSRRPDNTEESKVLLLQTARLLMLQQLIRDQKENPNEAAILLYGPMNEGIPGSASHWDWLSNRRFRWLTGKELLIHSWLHLVDMGGQEVADVGRQYEGPLGQRIQRIPSNTFADPDNVAAHIFHNYIDPALVRTPASV